MRKGVLQIGIHFFIYIYINIMCDKEVSDVRLEKAK